MSEVDLEEQRRRVNDLLETEGTRVVIFMDDIDRLDRDEIHSVFRLRKLAADFSFITYVVAFDETVVGHALAERYPGSPESGSSFLEKIIQVPMRLPPASEADLLRLCLREVSRLLEQNAIEITDEDVYRFRDAFDPCVGPSLRPPRLVGRYINSLEFVLPMVHREVNAVDLLLLEAMRIFYTELHEAVFRAKAVVLGVGRSPSPAEVQTALSDGLSALSGAAPSRALALVAKIFPRAQTEPIPVTYGPE